MLGDVEVDWSMPAGYGVRAMHQTDGVTDDLLVCIPLPGEIDAPRAGARGTRYRMSMLVPDELASAPSAGGVAHGFEGALKPELHHIQAVIDRLSPEPTTARNFGGRRCSGSATASSTPMAAAACSSQAMPPTSIRRPVRRV